MGYITFDGGVVEIDDTTGNPVQFRYGDTDRAYLLDSTVSWHTAQHNWSVGSIVTNRGASQWNMPSRVGVIADNAQCSFYELSECGMELEIKRAGGRSYTETFAWCNVTDEPIAIDLLGIQTPFNDRYPSASQALKQCVNAHIFTGGVWSWVLAEPMSGITADDPALGLIVTQGSLSAYSIESRTEYTGSNTRGHIVLKATDRALNPDACGGQPSIIVQPHESYVLQWEVKWYTNREDFLAQTVPPATLSGYCAQVGEQIEVTPSRTVREVKCVQAVLPAYAQGRYGSCVIEDVPKVDDVTIFYDESEQAYVINAEKPGMYTLELRDERGISRTDVLFHASLQETVRNVCEYIVRHHCNRERPYGLDHTFVPVDTRTGLRIDDGGWPDWTDGSERIGMAILLQKALNKGWIEGQLCSQAREAIEKWKEFALRYLLDGGMRTRRGSSQSAQTFGERIYDMPWMAEFFCDFYEGSHDYEDLNTAALIVERMRVLEAKKFLAIGFAQVAHRIAQLLWECGQEERAGMIERDIVSSADYFLTIGDQLPVHEVAYEQSMVAPLVDLYIQAYRLTGCETYVHGIQNSLPWLLSFSGPQPHARLYGVGLRHWDGHWFGIGKQFGDVFPHYWSSLTAVVLARLPEELRTVQTDALSVDIMRANMANYNPDGSGTCAFMYPSSIDGIAQHRPDPLSNDQYWHLALWLRLIAQEGFVQM